MLEHSWRCCIRWKWAYIRLKPSREQRLMVSNNTTFKVVYLYRCKLPPRDPNSIGPLSRAQAALIRLLHVQGQLRRSQGQGVLVCDTHQWHVDRIRTGWHFVRKHIGQCDRAWHSDGVLLCSTHRQFRYCVGRTWCGMLSVSESCAIFKRRRSAESCFEANWGVVVDLRRRIRTGYCSAADYQVSLLWYVSSVWQESLMLCLVGFVAR